MLRSVTGTVLVLMSVVCGAQATKTTQWVGTGDWFDDTGNWSDGVPGAGDTAVVVSGTVMLTNATPVLATFTNAGGVVTFSNWWARLEADTVTLAGGTLRPNNAFLETEMSNRVWIVCSNLTVGSSAVIHADALGYVGVPKASGQGPGKGYVSQYRAGGAGHGGPGGNAVAGSIPGNSYGEAVYPTSPGSSGGGTTSGGGGETGGNGGGAIRIDASGTITLSGAITANGAKAKTPSNNVGLYGGSGAGGSILLCCHIVQGNGMLAAIGADYSTQGGGEGGGGRIAVHYDTVAQALLPVPTLAVSASSGKRLWYTESQFGTLYFSDTALLTEAVSNMRGWLHIPGFTSWSPASLTLTNSYLGIASPNFQLSVAGSVGGSGDRMLALGTNAVVTVGGNLDAAVTFMKGGSCTVAGSLCIPATTWLNYNSLTAEADITAAGGVTIQGVWRFTSAPTNGTVGYGSILEAGGDMTVVTNAQLYLYSNPTNGGSALLTMSNLVVTADAVINADSGGFGGRHIGTGYGPDGGSSGGTYGGGGGFGGRGGLSLGGSSNGLAYAPLWPGSAGGGRSPGDKAGNVGGGLVRVEARGGVTVDGTVTANGAGTLSYSGSGAGGGIFIRSASFDGAESGVLRANGGSRKSNGGAGGGGRIAVWYGDIPEDAAAKILTGQHATLGARFSAGTNLVSFAGLAEALKGTGTADGAEDGTVFFVTLLPPVGTMLLLR